MSYIVLNFNQNTYPIPAPGDKSQNWGAQINSYLSALASGAAAQNVVNTFTAQQAFNAGIALATEAAPSQTANLQLFCNVTDGNLYALLPIGHSAVPINLTISNPSAPAYVAKTIDYTIKATDNTTRFSNLGASSTVTFTLPAATVGLEFYFTCVAAQQMTVQPTAGSMLVPGGNSGASATVYGNITANRYTSFRISCVDGTNWVLGQLTGNISIP